MCVLGIRDSVHTAPVSGTDITLIIVMAAAYAWCGSDDENLFVKHMR